MRKIVLPMLFVAMLTGIALNSFSQNAFQDAPTVLRLVGNPVATDTAVISLTDNDALYPLLKNYVTASEGSSKDGIVAAFATNPYMRFDTSTATGHGALSGQFQSEVNSIGSLNVTTIANGIASLMVERAKQELTIAFFNRFKKFTTDYPEFQILFPQTTATLNKLLTYTYPQMLPVLRNSFFQDLGQIPYNLEGVFELPKYATLLNNYPEVLVAVQSLKLVHQIQSGQLNAADAMVQFASLSAWDQTGSLAFKNMKTTVKFAAIFSTSLRSTDPSKNWISLTQAQLLLNSIPYTNVYLGLLWQLARTDNLQYYFDSKNPDVGTNLTDLLWKLRGSVSLIQNRVSQFINVAGEADLAFATISANNTAGKANTNDDYYNYINASIDVINFAFGVVKVFDPRLSVDSYMTIAKDANSLYKDIYTKQYTQTVSDALDILTQVHTLTAANTKTNVLTMAGALDKASALDGLEAFAEKVKPYALFIANVVEAQSASDVQAALENVILPVGSSSIKKNTKFNVSIQSYLGAFAVTSNVNSAVSGTWSDKFGVTAPIGISITPGFLSWRNGGAISLFGELFDLGAIVDYQLKSDSTVNSSGNTVPVVSKNYSIKLGQIVSPGVYLVYGFFGNLPLALGFGGQYGPGLSKINAGGMTVVGNPSWRYNFFLTVDLPFFNLVNINRTKN
jgi:hypothetical protein